MGEENLKERKMKLNNRQSPMTQCYLITLLGLGMNTIQTAVDFTQDFNKEYDTIIN